MPSFLAPLRPSWQQPLRHRRGPWFGNHHSVWVPLSISDFGNRRCFQVALIWVGQHHSAAMPVPPVYSFLNYLVVLSSCQFLL